MRIFPTLLAASVAAAASLAVGATLGACDLDVGDLNNPGLDQLENNPTPSAVSAACTGLIIGHRRNVASENGYIMQVGILGHEAYNFDAADPRYISELLAGTLNQGSPFGGNFWPLPYINIRDANIVLHAVDKVAEFSEAQKASIRGFAKTMQALDLLEVINTHDTNGAVIDTDHGISEPLGAVVDKAATFAQIVKLLDGAKADLMAGGDAFPFNLSAGYTGFDKPATFLKFNRAIRARVAIYLKDNDGALDALAESFIDDTAMADLSLGVYHVFGTSSGDTANALVNPNIYVYPAIATDAQKNGAVVDARFTKKVMTAKKPGAAQGLASTLAFTLYTTPTSPVPVIRNEELILIRAEAEFGKNDFVKGTADLNLVRVRSGGLALIAPDLNATNYVDALLYEREYSLLFEGHRWIDLRRFDKLKDLPKDKPDFVINVRYPMPLNECNARPAAECKKDST
jgi:starch-binding outer membrane protein, SusD/RagB family